MTTTMSRGGLPPSPPSAQLRGRWRLAGVVIGSVVTLIAVGVVLWLSSSNSGDTAPTTPIADASGAAQLWSRPAVSAEELTERTGVTITMVAITGGGGLVDVRYQVIDPDLASALHDPATPPALIEEQTGLVVHDLLMEHAHTGPFHQGETYYLIFNNPDNWVQRGSSVTVLLGDAEVTHVVVS